MGLHSIVLVSPGVILSLKGKFIVIVSDRGVAKWGCRGVPRNRVAKVPQTYKPGLEEGFGKNNEERFVDSAPIPFRIL